MTNEPKRFENPPPEMEAQIRNIIAEGGGYITEAEEWSESEGKTVNVLTVYQHVEPMPAPVENESPFAKLEELDRLGFQNRVTVPTVSEQLASRVQAVKNRWPVLQISDNGALWMVAGDKKNSDAIRNAALAEAGL